MIDEFKESAKQKSQITQLDFFEEEKKFLMVLKTKYFQEKNRGKEKDSNY